jgi:hypothetical protein
MALQHKHAVTGHRAGLSEDDAKKALLADLTAVRKRLFREHRCAPWRAALPIYLHIPLWVDFSFGTYASGFELEVF